MPDGDRFAFQRLVQRIEGGAKAVVIIVDEDGTVDTAAQGVQSDTELFQILHHVASGVAEELVPALRARLERQARQPRILMPYRNGWAK